MNNFRNVLMGCVLISVFLIPFTAHAAVGKKTCSCECPNGETVTYNQVFGSCLDSRCKDKCDGYEYFDCQCQDGYMLYSHRYCSYYRWKDNDCQQECSSACYSAGHVTVESTCQCQDGTNLYTVSHKSNDNSWQSACNSKCEQEGHSYVTSTCGCPDGASLYTTQHLPSDDSWQDACDSDCVTQGHWPVEAEGIPLLEHFLLTENKCTENEINLVFTPKGSPLFYLHLNLKFENGRDVLSTWCTDNESLCKAVGNGKDCGEAAPTGENAWCYKAN